MIKRLLYRPETILGIFLLIISYIFIWSDDNWKKNTMSSDGRGYYAYLPAIFLYQDLTYETNTETIERTMDAKFSHHYILKDVEGNIFNKCFPGVAVVQLPFFILATLFSLLLGLPVDGYNGLYMFSITLTGISSALIGYHFLKKLLLSLDLNRRTAILAPLLIFLGTNAFFYAYRGSSIGHIHSYAAIAVFLYFCKKWLTTNSVKSASIACFVFGLIFIIRPTNVLVVLLVPYLAGSMAQLKHSFVKLFKNWNWLYPLAFVMLPILLLPIVWYAQTGHWIVWSYSSEGFYFSNPKFVQVLFSFRNGLFIYSPLALLAMIGLYYAFKKSKFEGAFLLIYLLVNTYLISSWWCFAYGGGFGHRAFVEHQVFFGILLAYGLSYFPYKKIYLSLIICCSVLSMLQTYQFMKGILPNNYSTAEIYGHLFLRLDDAAIAECRPQNDEDYYGKTVATYDLPLNSNHFDVTSETEFLCDTKYDIKNFPVDHQYYLEVDYTKMRLDSEQFEEVFLVIDGRNNKEETIHYNIFPLYEIRSEALHKWKAIHLGTQLPKDNVADYKIYIWNKGRRKFNLKDVSIKMRHISAKDF